LAGDAAQIVGAAFTAVAALAALLTVVVDLRRQREARVPQVTAALAVHRSRVGTLLFANAGPGLAVQLGFWGVIDGREVGAIVGRGLLFAGEEATVPLRFRIEEKGDVPLTWAARDVDNNLHVWSYDGRYRRIPRDAVLRRSVSVNSQDLFREMYPEQSDVAIVGDDSA